MKDFANRKTYKKSNTLSNTRASFKSKKNTAQISFSIIGSLVLCSFFLIFFSNFYFDTDIKLIEPREETNSVRIDFPSSLLEDNVLVETFSSLEDFSNCSFFVQVETFGEKKYAYETTNSLNEIKDIFIDEIQNTSNPGKIFYRVMNGPFENRSAANNSKEIIVKLGFSPMVRTICK